MAFPVLQQAAPVALFARFFSYRVRQVFPVRCFFSMQYFFYQVQRISPVRYSFAEPHGLPVFLSSQYLSVRQKRYGMLAQMQRQANAAPVVQPVLFFWQPTLSPVMTPFFAALPVCFAVFAAPRNRYAAVFVRQPAAR